MNTRPCRFCGSIYHFPFQCAKNPKKKKPLKKIGKRTLIYEDWKHSTAKPYLDRVYGHVCSYDGCNETKNLDVDHIKNRSTHPKLKMDLTNVRYLCRLHHQERANE
jgi:hypothetical protein